MASTLHNAQPPASKREGYMNPRRRSSYSAPVVFVLVVLGIIFVMSVVFRVSDIQVEGNTHYTDEEIIRAIDIEEGDFRPRVLNTAVYRKRLRGAPPAEQGHHHR